MAGPIRYQPSPIGLALHAWINKPDTKFNADGLYHTGLILEGPEAEEFRTKIDADVERAYATEMEAMTSKMKPGEKKAAEKAWTKYHPYKVELDPDTGNPTGRIIFNFKQNAKIPQPDGAKKVFVLGIRDSQNKPIPQSTPVYGGATIRVLYKPRDTKVAGPKLIGVRLDFSMVQLIKASDSSGGGFDEVAGGYVGEETQGSDTDASGDAANSEY